MFKIPRLEKGRGNLSKRLIARAGQRRGSRPCFRWQGRNAVELVVRFFGYLVVCLCRLYRSVSAKRTRRCSYGQMLAEQRAGPSRFHGTAAGTTNRSQSGAGDRGKGRIAFCSRDDFRTASRRFWGWRQDFESEMADRTHPLPPFALRYHGNVSDVHFHKAVSLRRQRRPEGPLPSKLYFVLCTRLWL